MRLDWYSLSYPVMNDLLVLFAHLLATLAKRLGPGGIELSLPETLC